VLCASARKQDVKPPAQAGFPLIRKSTKTVISSLNYYRLVYNYADLVGIDHGADDSGPGFCDIVEVIATTAHCDYPAITELVCDITYS